MHNKHVGSTKFHPSESVNVREQGDINENLYTKIIFARAAKFCCCIRFKFDSAV